MTQPVPLVVLAIVIPALLVAAGIPLLRGRVKPNPWYGVRTAKTLASTKVWYEANRLCGIYLILAAVVTLGIWGILAFLPLGVRRMPVYLGILALNVLLAAIFLMVKVRKI